MRFRFDLTRPQFDVVTAIELGDLDRGYRPIDITRASESLYSLTCPLFLAVILVTIPDMTHGALRLTAKTRDGVPLTTRVDALQHPRSSTPDLLTPRHTLDKSSVATTEHNGEPVEIKEWQAVMDYLRRLPAGPDGGLPVLAIDDRATEVRGIQEG
jgi:5'-nucleotidase